MLNLQVIGCGAAGNKAVINLVNKGFIGDYLLVNSTNKDIPVEYRNDSMIFGSNSDSIGGCGKERELGKRLILEDTVNGITALDAKIDKTANAIIVCGSTEGGSGSASIPIISKYINQVLHKSVIAVLFFGFNDDVRGMQNSIEICQELSKNIGVIAICNSKFMNQTKSKLIAEMLANDEFSRIVYILSGKGIRESSQNIDDTDILKVITTPGYMNVEHTTFQAKNIDQYTDSIEKSLDCSVSMSSPNKSAKRIAVIFSVKDGAEYVDYSCDLFKARYGIAYELFVHVQDCAGEQDNVTCIISGQKLPIEEVNSIYDSYLVASQSVDKTEDNFFNDVCEMKGNHEDNMFNMLYQPNVRSVESDKASFFKEFGMNKQEIKQASKKDNKPNEY